MKILLINPNRYRRPPVPPLSLEYLDNALRHTVHDCEICDLCFQDEPVSALETALDSFQPDIAALTIRNIDTVLYENNIFFLDEIKTYADSVKKRGIPVVLGGAGFSFVPGGILEYIGADYGIKGPGEKAFPALLDMLAAGAVERGTVLDGWEYGIDPDLPVVRGDSIDLARYVREGGLAGFQTQKGCLGNCYYCGEAVGSVLHRSPESIVNELVHLADRGITDYHLCDSEFNQDLAFCHSFLEYLITKGPKISWALYMRTSPFDDCLFELLKKSGANMLTISTPTGGDSIADAGKMIALAKKYDLAVAVDLLLGFPGDTRESIAKTIDDMRAVEPDTVGVNATLRLAPSIPVAKEIMDSAEHRKHLLGAVENNPDFIRPVFYNHITVEMLREIIGDDPRFRIEGFERSSNYERLTGKK